jgi:uncharacterized protein (TIGR00255 family)
MIKSMTGYGKSNVDVKGKKISIEARSVNSKSLDISFRMPSIYREKEIEIRTLISDLLKRGKVDFSINIDIADEESTTAINKQAFESAHKQLNDLCTALKINDADLLNAVMRMPDVLKPDKKELESNEWNAMLEVIKKTLTHLDEFRISEGTTLDKEIKNRVGLIVNLLVDIENLDTQRLPAVKEKLRKQVAELSDKVDNNRFEQELIYYAERLDITEEKVRLKTHCDYFIKTMLEAECGKKLSFIAQEIGREINTIGSKANDADMQKTVVQMKDELEKIKEQLNNIL